MFKKIVWEVIHGEKLGRQLWFPTANIAYNKNDIEDAVYFLNIIIENKIYSGMWSHMVKKWVFEAHIFHFDMDIYWKEIEIILLKKIRDNKKFGNLDALVHQIKQDKILCENIFIPVLTFWSFDLVHKWHEYYLFEAKKYGTHLTTIVASDENIFKIKWKTPLHNITQRIKAIQDMWICDKVFPGSKDKPMQWIEKIKPSVICLWYDQCGPFVDKLSSEIAKLVLDTHIVRIPPHKPEVFKSSLLKEKSS